MRDDYTKQRQKAKKIAKVAIAALWKKTTTSLKLTILTFFLLAVVLLLAAFFYFFFSSIGTVYFQLIQKWGLSPIAQFILCVVSLLFFVIFIAFFTDKRNNPLDEILTENETIPPTPPEFPTCTYKEDEIAVERLINGENEQLVKMDWIDNLTRDLADNNESFRKQIKRKAKRYQEQRQAYQEKQEKTETSGNFPGRN